MALAAPQRRFAEPLRDSISVFLCDDVEAFRALIRFTLEDEDDMVVAGEASDGRAGIAGVADAQPDVVLLDLAMPGVDGLQALPKMREAAPDTRIIILSGFTAASMERQMLRAGASAYLEKGAELEDVVATIRAVAGGVSGPSSVPGASR